jgi:hypothetical protein
MVIALTHMRWHNDRKLAMNCPEIDLILGGHDHEYHVEKVILGSDSRPLNSPLQTTFTSGPKIKLLIELLLLCVRLLALIDIS